VIETFKVEDLKFTIGEKIIFTKSLKDKNILNSDQGKIVNIFRTQVTIKLENNKLIKMDMNGNEIKHIDYAYALTTHKAQGATFKNVIGIAESKQKLLTNQKNFYVTISRAKNNATLIVDNKDQIVKKLETSTGIKLGSIKHQENRFDNLSQNQMVKSVHKMKF
jgi:ATP-dependent exoDNAse (exonuclease V) alpha subunit